MNNSSRGTPLDAIALPTASSLMYERAVSRDRYPASSAAMTARSVSSAGI